ncbi:MAG TPA: glutaredoxin family protein [Candidatus Paceibacterota bacterium]|jgi:glutaredoxin-like YruB-family protein|nr:glutaredoxin family protein [Candidatus Paceibacterota bacterium]HRS47899.1 glutaredoxin family protein [Candidatus Paceibacterota bacterium]
MSQEIKIYTTPFCPYCELAKKFFKEHNLEYQEINVADDDEAREELIAKTKQYSVPVIEIGSNLIIGFNQRSLKEILNIKD